MKGSIPGVAAFLGGALIFLLCLFTTLQACVAPQVQRVTVIPVMADAWPRVRSDVERGIDAAMDQDGMAQAEAADLHAGVAKMTVALGSKDPALILAAGWGKLELSALRGIDARVQDGEISELVAGSYRERVTNFTQAVNSLAPVVAGGAQ